MKTLILILTVFLVSPLLWAREVTLAWNPNPEPEITGYEISYGTKAGILTHVVPVGKVTEFTIKDLPVGEYFFAVRALVGEIKSDLSNEVSALIKPGAPKGLRQVVIIRSSVDLEEWEIDAIVPLDPGKKPREFIKAELAVMEIPNE